jgi:hypothetical protein
MPTLEVFGGIAPKVNPRLLPVGKGQAATNCRVVSGKLEAFRAPVTVDSPVKTDPISIYKVDLNGSDRWLTWNVDVDVVPSPVIGETLNRVYYSGDGEPRVTTVAIATAGPDAPVAAYTLGVPRPVTAPSVSPTGGSGMAETRVYFYTFVDPWGQEGQPSPPTSATGFENSTNWSLSNMNLAPNGGGSVTAVSSSGGVTTFTLAANDTRFLRVGEEVVFAGVHASLNRKWKLTAVTPTTVDAVTGSTHTGSVSGTWSRVAGWVPGTWRQRIYRSDTSGNRRFVAEQNAAATYVDTISNANLSTLTLESENYAMPPADLSGFVITPNGSLFAMRGNDIYISEPFKPWAWPSQYIRPIPFTPVGLGVAAGVVVVATKGLPYVLAGYHPENVQPVIARNSTMPCASKRSVVSTSRGVVWDTPYGLAICAGGEAAIITEALFTEREWAPYRVTFAGHYDGKYLGWNGARGFLFDLGSGDFSTLSIIPVCAREDAMSGLLHIVHNGAIRRWDASPSAYLDYDWWSGILVSKKPTNFGASRVDADYNSLGDASGEAAQEAEDLAYNTAILARLETFGASDSKTRGCVDELMLNEGMVGGSELREFSYEYSTRYLSIRFYANGELVRSKSLDDANAFRLPAGFKHHEWYVRLSGNIRSDKVELAETMKELRRL